MIFLTTEAESKGRRVETSKGRNGDLANLRNYETANFGKLLTVTEPCLAADRGAEVTGRIYAPDSYRDAHLSKGSIKNSILN